MIAGVRIGLSFWIEKFSTGRQIRLCRPPSLRRQPLPFDTLYPAIMIVGALVLVEVTAGITKASMTRSP